MFERVVFLQSPRIMTVNPSLCQSQKKCLNSVRSVHNEKLKNVFISGLSYLTMKTTLILWWASLCFTLLLIRSTLNGISLFTFTVTKPSREMTSTQKFISGLSNGGSE